MKLFNTLSQKKEVFRPLKPMQVGMYVCGPTVYDVGHIGHARSAVAFDVIRRYFLYKGWKVTFVSNITDVDDKIIARSAELGISEQDLVERIIPEYSKDYGDLRILPPDHQPRATEYVAPMVALTEQLLDKGVAYATDDGIYFEVAQYRDYGALSHQKMEELRAGARVALDEKKRNPEDFALWKKEKQGEPSWPGPRLMRGRPGWHIECSAMSAALLGETIDIHGGGIDLQFPHHEDERAQSEMATGKTFVSYWMHNGHVQINKEKMSKSLGNFFTIKEILAQYHPLVVRYFLLSTHYRMPIEFSNGVLEQARQGLARLHDFMRRLKQAKEKGGGQSAPSTRVASLISSAQKGFELAMEDDFEISEALASIFEFVKEINAALDRGEASADAIREVWNFMRRINEVLGVLEEEESRDDEAAALIKERDAARAAKDFRKADELRVRLKSRGIELEDTKDGTIWKKTLKP